VATQLDKQSLGLYGMTGQPMVLDLLEKLIATQLVKQSLGLYRMTGTHGPRSSCEADCHSTGQTISWSLWNDRPTSWSLPEKLMVIQLVTQSLGLYEMTEQPYGPGSFQEMMAN
jgi:hypothetical protein